MSLNNGKWTILRKLGSGVRASVWLATSQTDPSNYEAIKVYKVAETPRAIASSEVRLLKYLVERDNMGSYPWLVESFVESGPTGDHLCIVTHTNGKSLADLLKTNANGGYLALHGAKVIASQILEALADLHKEKVVHNAVIAEHCVIGHVDHADVQTANAAKSNEFAALVLDDATAFKAPSEPINSGSEIKWNEKPEHLAGAGLELINLRHAFYVHEGRKPLSRIVQGIPAAPEALTGGRVGFPSDIFQFGCLVFRLLTGVPFFGDQEAATEEVLSRKINIQSIEERLSVNKTMRPEDTTAAASLLTRCLAFDQSERPSIDSLFDQQWIQEGDCCDCGWCGAAQIAIH